jgi:antitoxin HicB
MNTKQKKRFDHGGSSFDSFLAEEGLLEEAEAIAIKRVIAWQLEAAMQKQGVTKRAMAERLRTSRSQLDRLLDPENPSVSLEALARAARAVGKTVSLRITDIRPKRRRPPKPSAATRSTRLS